MTEFSPQYLSIDYLSLVDKFKSELEESEIFKDYDIPIKKLAEEYNFKI